MEEPIAIAEENLPEEVDTIQMVSFKLEGELFGVDILMVQEIIKQMPMTVVPDAPDFIAGIINLRGRIIPIIDLRKRLKLKADHQVPAQDACYGFYCRSSDACAQSTGRRHSDNCGEGIEQHSK